MFLLYSYVFFHICILAALYLTIDMSQTENALLRITILGNESHDHRLHVNIRWTAFQRRNDASHFD